MEAKQIKLNEWESFGGGGFGESFYHKTDDSVILKLNKTIVSAQKAQEEFRRSKAVYDMGIPSATPPTSGVQCTASSSRWSAVPTSSSTSSLN